jgi:hypothetical protein
MEASILRDATINDAKPEFWGSALEYVLGHAKYCTIKNTGKDLLLNCKMVIDNTGLGENRPLTIQPPSRVDDSKRSSFIRWEDSKVHNIQDL